MSHQLLIWLILRKDLCHDNQLGAFVPIPEDLYLVVEWNDNQLCQQTDYSNRYLTTFQSIRPPPNRDSTL